MSVALLLANTGAIATLLLGALGLLLPSKAAAFVSISPVGPNGKSEIRATYGGLFVSLAVLCLLTQSGTVFGVAAVVWLGALCGRLLSIVIDSNHDIKNIGGCVLEGAIGLLLLAPTLSA